MGPLANEYIIQRVTTRLLHRGFPTMTTEAVEAVVHGQTKKAHQLGWGTVTQDTIRAEVEEYGFSCLDPEPLNG